MSSARSGSVPPLNPARAGDPSCIVAVELNLQEQCLLAMYRYVREHYPETGDTLEQLMERVSAMAHELHDDWHRPHAYAAFLPARPHIIWQVAIVCQDHSPGEAQ